MVHDPDKTWLITGGAGFIGSHLVLALRRRGSVRVVNLDKLTYAGNVRALDGLKNDPEHVFVRGDIGDRELVARLLRAHQPQVVLNLAAESHVDRSIAAPAPFVETNVLGAFRLLEAVTDYWRRLEGPRRDSFRFVQVSTDEVYGDLEPGGPPAMEHSPYAPSSPYAASKASADHFVRAFHRTYGLPTLITSGSNTYGPFQYPEKLIPLTIRNALRGEPLPLYGDGLQVRDWLYVEDHAEALRLVAEAGQVGGTYHLGGQAQRTNTEVVRTLCAILDREASASPHCPHSNLIAHVADRPGHDRRYALDDSRIRSELGWRNRVPFEEGLVQTVRWYVEHPDWPEAP